MGLLIHHPRHHFRTAVMATADLEAMLMIAERGLDFAGAIDAEPESYPCEWCGHDHARLHRGATLCAGCIAELDARGSEPRLMRTDADIDALCDVGAIPDDDHEDEADRWEGDE